MKTILNLKRSIFFVTALTTVISFTACSDDDDPKIPSPTDVYGTYKGKMSITAPMNRATSPEDPSSGEIAATVNNDTIYFESFPVDIILTAIEGAENAASIIESIDKVNFKVGYESKLNQAQDSVGLTLDPKPMEFAYKVTEGENEIQKNVKVTFEIPENQKSAYSAKVLRFHLIATEIMVDDNLIDSFDALYYNFYLNKQ